jgi:hypothetical protein
LYFQVYPILALALVVAIVAAVRCLRSGRREPVVLFAILSLVVILYVTHLGGDFMFARFLLPITPLLYLGLEDTLRGRRGWLPVGTAVAVVATLVAQIPHRRIFPGRDPVQNIVDERNVYPADWVTMRKRQGEELRAIFQGLPSRFGILGGQASLAYFARLSYVVEKYGLTDRAIARKPVEERGRPGHEKVALESDLIDRHVNFRFRAATDSLPGALNEVQFGEMRALNVVYDPDLMAKLKGRPGFRAIDYREYFDMLMTHGDEMSEEEVRKVWVFYRDHYFVYDKDVDRLSRIARLIMKYNIDPRAPATPAAPE